MENKNSQQHFEEVYQAHRNSLFRFAHFKTSDYATALDITQDTFLKFWKALSNGQVIQNPKAFLFFVANGLIVDHYRRNNRRSSISLDGVEGLVFADDDLDGKLDKEQLVSQLLSRLRNLREEYKDVLILYYIEEVGVPDIAAILQKTENAVRVLIHRALQELKKSYERP